jgi:hypothetical protein
VTYINRRKLDLTCGPNAPHMLDFWEHGEHGFKHPPGKWPACQVPIWLPQSIIDSLSGVT